MHLILRCLALGLLAEEEGATASEHALLLTLIAVAIVAGLTFFGGTVSSQLYTASNTVLPLGS